MELRSYILAQLPSSLRDLLRLLRYRVVRVLMGRDITVDLDGRQFRVLHNNIDELRAARRFLSYEGAFASTFIDEAAKATAIYDIGAYIGLYSLAAATSSAIASIVAFEPQPANIEAIRKNVAANKCERIQVLPFALGDAAATATVVGRGSTSAMARTNIQKNRKGEEVNVVKVRTLDSVVQAQQLKAPELVKIDVEGYEAHVLRGMRRVLESDRPIVFLELHPRFLESFGSSAAWVHRYMSALNYDMRMVRYPESDVATQHKQTHVIYYPF